MGIKKLDKIENEISRKEKRKLKFTTNLFKLTLHHLLKFRLYE